MNKRDVKGLSIILLIVIYTILYRLFIINYSDLSNIITSSFLLIITFISYIFFGLRKIKLNRIKQNSIIIILTMLVIYFLVIFGLGYFSGFELHDFILSEVIKNVLKVSMFIITLEYLRYIFVSANGDKRYLNILFTISIIILEISYSIDIVYTYTIVEIFKLITTKILPIIVKNMLLTYMCKNFGIKQNIIYNLTLGIYSYIIPISPNISDYFISIIGLVFPLMIYIYTSRLLVSYYEQDKPDFEKKKIVYLREIPIVLFFVILVILVSGYFRFYLIGIASGSMEPVISKGDAVLLDKNIEFDELKIGDIIAYRNSNRIIVHRIVDKRVEENILILTTKGDFNNINDSFKVTKESFVGKVLFKVPYIAIPSVWLKENLGWE